MSEQIHYWACPKCGSTCTQETCSVCCVCNWRSWGENCISNSKRIEVKSVSIGAYQGQFYKNKPESDK